MAIYGLLQKSAFEPVEIERLVEAFESICRGLKFGQQDQRLREAVALKVIECAEAGERDPKRIHRSVMDDMQGAVPTHTAAA